MESFNKIDLKKEFWRRGEVYIWGCGLGLSAILLMIFLILYITVQNGLGVYWPKPLFSVRTDDNQQFLGQIVRENIDNNQVAQIQFKSANRDLSGSDFRWIGTHTIHSQSQPKDAMVLERMEWGNFHGFLLELQLPANHVLSSQPTLQGRFRAELSQAQEEVHTIQQLRDQVAKRNVHLNNAMGDEKKEILDEITLDLREIDFREAALHEYKALFQSAAGTEKIIPLAEIVRFHYPNDMSFFEKVFHNLEKVRELLFDEPRESNTEGGLFPAIFGTILLIIIMSICSFPLGVLAGIYLKEYAREGLLVKVVRIAVNNLAGIPSIVYGIFGLGFFVYGIGAQIDQIFFSAALPEPTFGTGGLLWASLTLGLLTIPVVIVSTEEALSSVPQAVRENSYALGATKIQTLLRICLPASSSGILTGFILSMARAAGEVAPLMITGVVKMAPALALDGQYPFLHLERKFMHLGFHIYDISCQSPNVEAAKPMIYVTTLLLIIVVLLLSGTAIYLREKLKRRYKTVSI